MSLSTDGFWKSGFWSTSFWADGFWFETSSSSPVVSIGGAGNKRKLRILPDGTRLYASEREVRQILSHFYQVKPVEKIPPKLRIKDIKVDVQLISFDKHIPKVYELKPVYRKGPDYQNFLKSMRREEEEFFAILEAL